MPATAKTNPWEAKSLNSSTISPEVVYIPSDALCSLARCRDGTLRWFIHPGKQQMRYNGKKYAKREVECKGVHFRAMHTLHHLRKSAKNAVNSSTSV
eukprot:4973074-Amphidinium_carterae.1